MRISLHIREYPQSLHKVGAEVDELFEETAGFGINQNVKAKIQNDNAKLKNLGLWSDVSESHVIGG